MQALGINFDFSGVKVTKGGVAKIHDFMRANKENITTEQRVILSNICDLIRDNAAKPKHDPRKITKIDEIIQRVVNIEKYIIAAGGISFTREFI